VGITEASLPLYK